MTKKIFLTIAMFLVMLIVFAQTGTGQQPALPGANNIPDAATDTLNIITEANETIQALTGLMPNIDRPDAEIVTVDDNEYILRKGYAYRMENFDDIIDSVNEARHEFFDDSEQKMMIPIMAICFGVPCFTLIVVLVLLLMFFMKRTQAKNEIIGKAIDANYQLPDSFFNSQTGSQAFDYSYPADGHTPASPSQKDGSRVRRDPKNFSSAITLLAVGFALILFFGAKDMWSVAFLAGGIPFFLGVGKLIGYFYVPGFAAADKKTQSNYPLQQPPYGGYPDQPYRNTPPAGQYSGSYPPPFTPERRDNQPKQS